MRKLRIVYWSLAVLSAISIATFFAKADEAYEENNAMTIEDLGSFIESRSIADEPLKGLGEFLLEIPKTAKPKLVLPVPGLPVREASWVSDGNFTALSASWKRGVVQVAKENRCKRHAAVFSQDVLTLSPLFQKAQAIVESNCDATASGLDGEEGIFQVMSRTCKEMGVAGDYRNSLINARCAAKLRIAFCKTVKGECPTGLMILAHNRGMTGARKVKKPQETEYLRKVDCAARVLKGMKCV